MRPIHEIIVHCSATKTNWMSGHSIAAKIREIRRWHVQGNGWSDIGYHFLIDRDGSVGAGRGLERTGAHVKGHNTGTIGICLIGGHGASSLDEPSDHFTIAQMNALRRKIEDLRKQFPDIRRVSGHNQYAAKGCPGFRVDDWYLKPPAPPANEVPPSRSVLEVIVDAIRAWRGRK